MLWQKLKADGEKASLVCDAISFEERQKELLKFRTSKNKILLTADVSARGLDVKDTKIVVNYDLPLSATGTPNPKLFVCRITRAGRMKKGSAITLLDASSRKHYEDLSKLYNFTGRKI